MIEIGLERKWGEWCRALKAMIRSLDFISSDQSVVISPLMSSEVSYFMADFHPRGLYGQLYSSQGALT